MRNREACLADLHLVHKTEKRDAEAFNDRGAEPVDYNIKD